MVSRLALLHLCLWQAVVVVGFSLPGFETSLYFEEQEMWLTPAAASDVLVRINAPSASALDPALPTTFVYYALPNGNTINQTVGCANATALDWHYLIQQIGAQTRRLRETLPDRNVVVSYLQSQQLSWPAWKQLHSADLSIVPALLEQVIEPVNGVLNVTHTILASHSGGGALLFALLNATGSALPPGIDRLVFLDSDYDYDDTPLYGDALVEWLQASPTHTLSVVCYDDRNITINGKPVYANFFCAFYQMFEVLLQILCVVL